jgi:hypothetical protein
LHLPPPDILTLDSSLLLFSTITVSSCGFIRAALTAQKNPAAPPPITIKRISEDYQTNPGKTK